jgi:hypothetical protein
VARPAAQALARLESELALIEHMGFTDYFLLVASIVGFARERGIPTVGRGSGASSIVSYTLGVTSVDPVRHGLCFERFLHPQRRDCPDLDVDLCWRRPRRGDRARVRRLRPRSRRHDQHARHAGAALGVPRGGEGAGRAAAARERARAARAAPPGRLRARAGAGARRGDGRGEQPRGDVGRAPAAVLRMRA